mgnify:CR=1 FL=1
MIGQAVDIVGQTGNPRTISGFQIHNRRKLHEEQARENNLDRILGEIDNLRKKKDK